ncbi:post-GPI attachment to proteins factor 3-like [Zingiber officinale]|uniref:post-GPI attachment to proteins factor 3-like n=1 Tax=Zingiber officinale TaxID=94328 RepID=UPI001C4B0545|nr:post-GPI attachment to proteins factor 3-like [Zingiber officinale]
MGRAWILVLFSFVYISSAANASDGDGDPLYRVCIEECGKTGTVGVSSIQHCQFSAEGVLADGPWYMQEPLYVQWKQWNCRSDCQYFCMMQREKEREELGLRPVKYHGKWPFKRWSVLQEPVSAILSALTLIIQFNGWLSFFLLSSYKLPLMPESGRTFYEFTCLWHFFGLLSLNAWFWDAIFHTQSFDLTEKFDYSSSVALLGYSLILAILRTFNVKTEASRVMVAAPLVAFLTTHILYLNFYELDYGLNTKVCLVMGIAQVLLWAIWAGVTRHPSRCKLWVVVVGGAMATLLALLYDFPPYKGYVDSHALWHATSIPLAYLWWSFVSEDAEFRTSAIMKKNK